MHEPLSIPAIRGKMGNWVYYSCVMPMSELARRVNFAKEIFPNPGLSQMVQRKLSGDRADEICRYLTERDDRFFNSLVVAFYKGPPTWYSGALTNQITSDPTNSFDVEDIRESGAQFGVLQFKGSETLFALDGQHRLAGIKVAQSKALLPFNDCVPVIFVAHNDNQSGVRRSRELFTTLNKEAKKVGVGDIIALDENDPAAIVTRMIVEGKTGLSGGKIAYKQTESIDPRADLNCITTIANIYYSCLNLFKAFHFKTKSIREIAALPRPEEEVIQKLLDLEKRYFASVGKCFPEFGEAINATTSATEIISKFRGGNGGHLLFRPVGITILTNLVCQLKAHRPHLSIEKCVKQVSAIPVSLDAPPYKNVLWEPRTKKMRPKGKKIVIDLLAHDLKFPQSKYYKKSLMEYEELTLEKYETK